MSSQALTKPVLTLRQRRRGAHSRCGGWVQLSAVGCSASQPENQYFLLERLLACRCMAYACAAGRPSAHAQALSMGGTWQRPCLKTRTSHEHCGEEPHLAATELHGPGRQQLKPAGGPTVTKMFPEKQGFAASHLWPQGTSLPSCSGRSRRDRCAHPVQRGRAGFPSRPVPQMLCGNEACKHTSTADDCLYKIYRRASC